MTQRQIIRFGKSAFCITLPQSWAIKNKLKKGDSLTVQETLRNSLEIIPNTNAPSTIEMAELDITERTVDEIKAFLLASYLNGYLHITLRGVNNGKVPFVRQFVQEFVAAEIMEVTANKIVINILWDAQSINLRAVISRIENITRSLFIETASMLQAKGSDSADIRDLLEMGLEVHRQTLLARRTITSALNNSALAQKFNLSSLELYYISYIVYFFGSIGEYTVEIAKIINEVRHEQLIDVTTQKELRSILETTLKHFEVVIESYNREKKGDHFSSNGWTEFEESLNTVQQKNFRKRIPAVPEYIKMIVTKIKEMEIFVINMQNSPR